MQHLNGMELVALSIEFEQSQKGIHRVFKKGVHGDCPCRFYIVSYF